MASPGSVLIIVENLPVPFDRRVWMEATTLAGAGYVVSVICPTGRGFEREYEQLEGVHIYRHTLPPEVSSARGYLREYASALLSEFRLAKKVRHERGFDVVHVCNPPDVLFLVGLWHKLRYGVRVIYDQHDLNPEMYEAKFQRRDVFYHGLRLAERLTYFTADVVIATNESHKATALERGRKLEENVFIVRSGPDLSRFVPMPPSAEFGGRFTHLVGYVGVMGEAEGIDYLLRAIRHIVHDQGRRDIKFMLIGSGPAAEGLHRLTRELHIDDVVEFTGRVPDTELIARLSSCDLCVNPDPKTPYNDKSTMNKVLEYMALGKPVVQFDVVEGRRSAETASAYAAANDEVDFARLILELLADPERRERMGREGRRRMEEALEWRHQAPRLLDAYERAMA
jgi:glycosyltransferase involved in cell wall biosynthesis